jgi:hypothetical protein
MIFRNLETSTSVFDVVLFFVLYYIAFRILLELMHMVMDQLSAVFGKETKFSSRIAMEASQRLALAPLQLVHEKPLFKW